MALSTAELSDPSKILGSQAQLDDSVAAQVTKLASKDSALNQMARTEGLKAANRRGLLNSSMAVGESQDAVLKNVLPIASQEANQAFQKNMAAKGFEYSMAGQTQQQGWQSAENVAARGWQTAENIAQRNFLGTQADLDRDLQKLLQQNQITSQEKLTYAQIASTEGIEAANRKLAADLQEKDIQFRMSEGNLNRQAAKEAQDKDIAFRKSESALDRSLQEQIAKWNLSSSDRNSASQMLTNMESMYQNTYSSIMANTNLTSAQRDSYLKAAKSMRDTQINLVQQMYNVKLSW
jgi:hypothetical protein